MQVVSSTRLFFQFDKLIIIVVSKFFFARCIHLLLNLILFQMSYKNNQINIIPIFYFIIINIQQSKVICSIIIENKILSEGTKLEEIRQEFLWLWKGYQQYAWGYDELKPISKKGLKSFGKIGLTIIESLDTMYIMDLKEELNQSLEWIDKNLFFNTQKELSVFETTIRVLGGLLSAYHLKGNKMLLKKANDLGERLLYAFNNKLNHGLPDTTIDFTKNISSIPNWAGNSVSTAEVLSLTLEFNDLGETIKKDIYIKK